MVSGPYAEGVRGMRLHQPLGANYFKIMQFLYLAYTLNSDPKMVILLKICTPLFKRLHVSLGIMPEYNPVVVSNPCNKTLVHKTALLVTIVRVYTLI